MKRKFLFSYILLAVFSLSSYAQNITGTWHGIMDDEYLQINITQKGNQICGFTYDYVLNDKSSYCKARYEGRYDPEAEAWYLRGTNFIEAAPSHVLMRIKIWKVPGSSNLRAAVSTGSAFLGFDDAMQVSLQRVSSKPLPIPGNVPPCFPEETTKKQEPKKQIPPVVKAPPVPPAPKPAPVRPKPAQSPVVKVQPKLAPAPVVVVKPQPSPQPKPQPTAKPAEAKAAQEQMASRKSVEQNKITVTDRNMKIEVLDNGRIDNDSISVFYNGKLLGQHIRLSDKSKVFELQLDENTSRHEVTIMAENLGAYPPNTAYVIVTVGGKKFEMNTEQNLNQNAVLVFNYVPPK